VREDAVIGIAQWLPEPGRPAENLSAALGLAGELARQGADLVVLPELWPCGYDPAALAGHARGAAEPLSGPRGEALSRRARELGIWLAAGSVPERGADGAVHNTGVLYDRKGRLRAWHRKAHLYGPTGEDKIFTPGGRLTVCRTGELGTVGLAVCFDGDFPETARALRLAGATLVIEPAAYEAEAAAWWETLYPALALANGQWWVMANQCGANPSGTLLGASQVLTPFGEVAARAGRAGEGERPPPELLCVPVPLRAGVSRAEERNSVLWMSRRPGLPVHGFGAGKPAGVAR